MNFRTDIFSFRIDNFNDNYVLVFDLTSMQDATENCYYPKLVAIEKGADLYFSSRARY